VAINYSAGLNPMYDRFSQQVQQSAQQQAGAYQQGLKAKDDRFNKLIQLGGSIGKSVQQGIKQDVDQFKKDASAEQKRLETLRDKYTIGSDSYLNLNNQIAGLKDKQNEQIQSYKDSGFLGFGRDKEELDLYKKDEVEQKKPKESEQGFLSSAFQGLTKGLGISDRDAKGMFDKKPNSKINAQDAESRIAKNNEAIASAEANIDRIRKANNPVDALGNPIPVQFTEEGNKLREQLRRNERALSKEGLRPQVREHFQKRKEQLEGKLKQLDSREGNRVDFHSDQLTSMASGYAQNIQELKNANKKLNQYVSDPKNVEKEQKRQRFLGEGFTDPNSGIQLNNRDLVTQEQRRYQENKEKEAREAQKQEAKLSRSAQTKLKLGMNLNENERGYYSSFNDEEFAQLQQEAQEPEFRQKITDAITFGKKFDLGDPKTQKIAESMNISGEELNDFIDEQYEEELYKDIQRSGDDFEALDNIAKKAEGRNLPTLTESRMSNLIEEAKQSQRDTIYGGLGTVLRSSDSAGALQAFEQRFGKKAQYLIDSEVINKTDYNKLLGSVRDRASKSATEADVKTKKSLFGLLDKNLEAYATLAQSGEPVDDALKGEIQSLAKQLNLDGNTLMADGASQESYKRQRAKINDISQKLSVENAVSKKLYNDVFGSGATVDFKGFRKDGSPNFDLREKQGQLDPVKLRNSFIDQYTRANLGTPPTTGQVDAFVEEMTNYNKVIRLGLTPSIRESRIQDSIEKQK